MKTKDFFRIFLIVVAIFVIVMIASLYNLMFAYHKWGTYTSPNESLKIVVYARDPWFFGAAPVKITCKKKKSWPRSYFTHVANDGGSFSERNISIEWQENSATIVLTGCEQEPQVLKINFANGIEFVNVTPFTVNQW